jgi:hypothetical protein
MRHCHSETKLRCSSDIVTLLYILAIGLLSKLNLISLSMLLTTTMKERTNRSSALQQMTVLPRNPTLLYSFHKDPTPVIGVLVLINICGLHTSSSLVLI